MSAIATEHEILPGYHLVKRIGSGGYGDVWEARAPGDLPKAVKILHGRFDEKRAESELKSLKRIREVRHPFLLSLERIEVVNDQLIVVSELADGCLKDRFDECLFAGQPGVPRHELFNYLAEAADVLDFMVAKFGLQHLDIKPENILLVGGHAKVADFGLVRDIHGGTQSLQGGLTPAYAPPEMFDGRPCEHSDQYSLAIVYQRMLTGSSPFSGETMAQLTAQHMHAPPDVSPLPASDHAAVLRALAKDPFERFPTCRAFIECLRDGNKIGASSFRAPTPNRINNSSAGAQAKAAVGDHTELVVENLPQSSGTSHHPTRDTVELGGHKELRELPPLESQQPLTIRPTLYLALGGLGVDSMRCLERQIDFLFGHVTALPAFRYLALDTSPLSHEGREDYLGSKEERTLERHRERTFLQIPLRPTEYYREQATKLLSWLSRRWIYNIPRSLNTGGLRPLGRLALVDHLESVRQRIEREVVALSDDSVANETQRQTGMTVDTSQLRVVVIGTLSGGTSSGTVWDIAQIVRSVCDQKGLNPPEITFLTAHYPPKSTKERELAVASSCASLGELAHYQCQGYPGDPACGLPPVPHREHHFDAVYVVDSRDLTVGHEALAISEICTADAISSAAPHIQQSRKETPKVGKEPVIRTIGKGTLSAEDLALINKLVSLVASRIAAGWAGKLPVLKDGNATEELDIYDFDDPESQHEQSSYLKNCLHQIRQTFHSLGSEIDVFVKGHFEQLEPPALEDSIESAIAGIDACCGNHGSRVDTELATQTSRLVNERLATTSKRITALIDQPRDRIGAALTAVAEAADCVTHAISDQEQQLAQIGSEMDALIPSSEAGSESSLEPRQQAELIAKYWELSRKRLSRTLQQNALVAIAGQLSALNQRLTAAQSRALDAANELSGATSANEPMDFAQFEALLRKMCGNVDSDPTTLFDQLVLKLDQETSHHLAQQPGALAAVLLSGEADVKKLTVFLVEHTRRCLLSTLAKSTIASAESRFLSCGGARRMLVCVGEDDVSQMILKLVQRELKAAPTIIPVDEPGVTVICEAQQIPIAGVAALIAEEREDFLEAASRLRTRVDVNWAKF